LNNQISLLSLLEEIPSKTCFVLHEGEIIFTSEERGVKPLLDYLSSGPEKKEITVVDKIMGKGAVFLAIAAGAKKIATPVISEMALRLAEEYELEAEYEKIVPKIINRTGDGFCPIETAVLDEWDVKKALVKITDRLKELNDRLRN